MRGSLAKFKLGLIIIGGFVIVLLVMVVTQASATKQDNNTYNRAGSIADTLNNYVDTKNTIPESLVAAGIYDAPATISYQKLSSSKYRFCVDYKTSASDFDVTNVEDNIIDPSSQANNSAVDSQTNTDLFIDTSHHKGQNCQVVQPYITSNYGDGSCYYNPNSTDNNQEYYACLQNSDINTNDFSD